MQLECRSVLREFHHINACLEHWVASETLSGDNCVECENCQRKTETKLWYEITQLPDYLVIHLKRFDFNLETLQLHLRLDLKIIETSAESGKGVEAAFQWLTDKVNW